MMLITYWLVDKYQPISYIMECFVIIQGFFILSFFIFFCTSICFFCWQFGNTLRMRKYFIATDACKYGDIETIKAMKLWSFSW